MRPPTKLEILLSLLCCAAPAARPQRIEKPFDYPADSIRDLASPSARTRQQAAQLLGNRSSPNSSPEDREKARAAVPALIKVLSDPDSSVRETAAFALGNVPGDPKLIVPALITSLQDKNESVRQHAVRSLGSIAKEPSLSVPALVHEIKSGPSSQARQDAADALKEFGPAAAPAVPDLIPLLKSPGYDPSYYAIRVIAAIGPPAAEAEPVLIEMLNKVRDSDVSADIGKALEAADALGKIGKDQPLAVTVVTSLLKVEDFHDRARAAGVLGEIGLPAEPAIPALTKALNDENSDVGEVAANAISSIATAARKAHHIKAIEPLKKAVSVMDASSNRQIKAKSRLCENAIASLEEDRDHNVK